MADKFDEATQRELAGFLEKQQAEARLNSAIHNFTGICWDKCVTGTPSTRFSRSEESCLSNCVERFLDTSLFMVRKIEEQRAAANGGSTKFT
ncbi:Tim10/DDP family zinc finger-domain-containing protein [Mycena belliarum]|uniref:Mitochondrial import inner membrane translocase subunit n=1 Tax=Mycena belliarum TaxID=1033014 RepID=A0AAD6UFU1_9AGAR|nr:Tim10/DDP family zinc finger-domain-containing protein [Mycena belliae]